MSLQPERRQISINANDTQIYADYIAEVPQDYAVVHFAHHVGECACVKYSARWHGNMTQVTPYLHWRIFRPFYYAYKSKAGLIY